MAPGGHLRRRAACKQERLWRSLPRLSAFSSISSRLHHGLLPTQPGGAAILP